jgi:sRNA-binding protein
MNKAELKRRIDLADRIADVLCFRAETRTPKAQGTRRFGRAVAGAVTPQELRVALSWYCNNAGYLNNLRAGTVRLDLDGKPTSVVSVAEEQDAKEKLAMFAARRARRRTAAVATTAPATDSVAPKRASLADLRQAARREEAEGSAP